MTYPEIYRYIKSDFVRYGRSPSLSGILFSALTAKNHCFAYSFWLRLCGKKNLFLYPIAKVMHYRLSRKYGVQIPPDVKIGYGSYIGHGVGIIINRRAVIGNNCNLSQFTTIGSNRQDNAAVIGDNVYVGPSVCIVGNVRIGDNATVGAGAVVVKDVPENATVAGVPAHVLSFENAGICKQQMGAE